MKKILKYVVFIFCIILTFPLGAIYRITGSKDVFLFFGQILSLIPDPIGTYFRVAFYRITLDRCSRDIFIGFGSFFSQPRAEVGEGVYIGGYCIIGMAKIGNHATIASAVHILSGKKQHGYKEIDVPIQEQKGEFRTVTIGVNSWIGSGAMILADIGRQNVVAAGSVVTRATGDYEVIAGNPAVVVKKLRS